MHSDTGCRWITSFMHWPTLSPEKGRYPYDGKPQTSLEVAVVPVKIEDQSSSLYRIILLSQYQLPHKNLHHSILCYALPCSLHNWDPLRASLTTRAASWPWYPSSSFVLTCLFLCVIGTSSDIRWHWISQT
jgi:hypothetical protein